MIIFVRHGHAEHNDNKELVHGVVRESKLTPKGQAQSKQVATILKEYDIKKIVCSPTVRTRHTAKIIADGIDGTVIEDERLIELSHGDWQGLLRSDVFTPERQARFETEGYTMRAPGGESFKDVEERMLEWLDEQTEDVIAVTHAGAMRCILRGILDTPVQRIFSMQIDNCGIVRVDKREGVWKIIFDRTS